MQGVFWVTHWGHQCQLHATQNGGNWWSNVGQLNLRKDLHSLKLLPVFVAFYEQAKVNHWVNMQEYQSLHACISIVPAQIRCKHEICLSLRLQLFNCSVTKVDNNWQVLIWSLRLELAATPMLLLKDPVPKKSCTHIWLSTTDETK